MLANNIAFKCTYNNGGEGPLVGFAGTCTDEIIKSNIENGRIWCNNEGCPCSEYYIKEDKRFEGRRPKGPCMESELFLKYLFGGGEYHSNVRKGSKNIKRPVKGKIAVLTTRFIRNGKEDSEEDRRIIGFYKINRVDDEQNTNIVYGGRDECIRLTLEEAEQFYFWVYGNTKTNEARWNTGLFRYLSDEVVKTLLKDLRSITQDDHKRKVIRKLLEDDFKDTVLLPPSGAISKTKESITKRFAVRRKYGGGGEGEDHKNLKEWIKNNPGEIGLFNVKAEPILEYQFPCWDTVDILFELQDGRDVVVEIETNTAHPGQFQAIKYRALRLAERGLPQNSDKVEAVLVAWDIPANIKQFCDKYGIRYFNKKL